MSSFACTEVVAVCFQPHELKSLMSLVPPPVRIVSPWPVPSLIMPVVASAWARFDQSSVFGSNVTRVSPAGQPGFGVASDGKQTLASLNAFPSSWKTPLGSSTPCANVTRGENPRTTTATAITAHNCLWNLIPFSPFEQRSKGKGGGIQMTLMSPRGTRAICENTVI